MAEVPLELPTGRVVGKFIFEVQDNNDPGEEPQLIPVTGDVTIKSSIDNLTIFDPTLGKFITFRGPHKAIVDTTGELSTPDPVTNAPMYPGMSLWSNDSDKLSVKGWTYTATFNLKTIDGKTLNLQPVTFTLATGQEVDLADVVQVPATPGYGLPQAEGAALRAEASAFEAKQDSETAIQMAQSVIDRADSGEFEGLQGLPGNATMRVDTTVGTRVFITDGVTEKMVSSDTGWRKITIAPEAGLIVESGTYYIRRIGNAVTMRLENIMLQPGIGSGYILTGIQQLPYGFRGDSADRVISGVGLANNAVNAQMISVFGDRVYWCFTMSPTGNSNAHPTTGLAGSLNWVATDDWPTTLPGTPV